MESPGSRILREIAGLLGDKEVTNFLLASKMLEPESIIKKIGG